MTQAGNALHYLAFSEYVYKSWGAPRGWQLTESVHDSSTGFHAAVYTNGSNAVIAFRGSELGTSDWVTNGIMASGQVPPQYRFAISESARLANKYRQYSIHYTGHSLGVDWQPSPPFAPVSQPRYSMRPVSVMLC